MQVSLWGGKIEKQGARYITKYKKLQQLESMYRALLHRCDYFPNKKEQMLYTSASASGSGLSPAHYTGLTIRHLNGA